MEDRRRFKRYSIYCPVQYKPESGSRDSSITMNLSEGGALISTTSPLSVSDNLIIRITLKNKDYFVRSRVIHVQDELSGGQYSVGVEFLERPEDFAMRFYEELETIMLYRRHVGEATGRELSLAEASMRWYRRAPEWL